MNELKKIFDQSKDYTKIDNALFQKHNVKKGLRNEDGTGVCVGLTKIADVVGYKKIDNKKIDTKGDLYYRGISLYELIKTKDTRYAYEEISFLLLFGHKPLISERQIFLKSIYDNYTIDRNFLDCNIRSIPTSHMMNKLQQLVLMLYNYDEDADSIDAYATLMKGIAVLAKLPSLLCYAYLSKYDEGKNRYVQAKFDLSITENILYMIREGGSFTDREAEILDVMFILHADHGGGNNSTFTNVVVSSAGSDLYSTMASSIASLKGIRHGGANIKAKHMIKEIISIIGYSKDREIIKNILYQQLHKEFYDHSGLIYGIGHAIYTLSDPRSEILKEYACALAKEKNKTNEYDFYVRLEECAKAVIYEEKGIHVSSNIDFYSGFVYELLGIPEELYTPLFVCARFSGWLAHNIENKLYDGRIMRPATKYVK